MRREVGEYIRTSLLSKPTYLSVSFPSFCCCVKEKGYVMRWEAGGHHDASPLETDLSLYFLSLFLLMWKGRETSHAVRWAGRYQNSSSPETDPSFGHAPELFHTRSEQLPFSIIFFLFIYFFCYNFTTSIHISYKNSQ